MEVGHGPLDQSATAGFHDMSLQAEMVGSGLKGCHSLYVLEIINL